MTIAAAPPTGRLTENVMHFVRVLRAAGLPIGPGQMLNAVEAVAAVDIAAREDFYWAMQAALVNRHDQREIFDQAFHAFWRNPRILDRMLGLVMPTLQVDMPAPPGDPLHRRLAEALHPGGAEPREQERPDVEVRAEMTWSERELLAGKDFEQMSTEELEQAKRVMGRLTLPVLPLPTRRHRPAPSGRRVDMRATLRRTLRAGGGAIPLVMKTPRLRPPPLVVLCDISGSMARYSRMLLHFLHALTNDRDRVHTFLFGTRLTNVTRYLRHREVDVALERIGTEVADWSGGTRIGHCVAEFNRLWSRRVLGQGAVVLFISDGLDRDAGEGLAREMERLHKSCRRLVWLNPLLRYARFEPKSSGARAILPHVDDFRAVHNLDSLGELAAALSRPATRR